MSNGKLGLQHCVDCGNPISGYSIYCRSCSVRGERHPRWGKKHTAETKRKISLVAKQRVGERNPFWGKHHSAETKKILSAVARGRYIGSKSPQYGKPRSLETKLKISTANKGKSAGNKHWNWKGGRCAEDTKRRGLMVYRVWRRQILQTADYLCAACGNPGANIVHHPFSCREFPELWIDPNNGVPMHRGCHALYADGSRFQCAQD